MTTWEPFAAITASHTSGRLTTTGVAIPQVEVTLTDGHIHMATLGPDGDVPEARMTATEARELARRPPGRCRSCRGRSMTKMASDWGTWADQCARRVGPAGCTN